MLSLPALPLGSEYVLARKCEVVVCPGDAWTVQVALRAGTPVVPLRLSGGAAANNHELSAEAEFWGEAVGRAGCGPRPLVAAHLKVSVLARALAAIVDPAAPERARARELAETMRASPNSGMAKALKIVADLAAPIAAIRSGAFNAGHP